MKEKVLVELKTKKEPSSDRAKQAILLVQTLERLLWMPPPLPPVHVQLNFATASRWSLVQLARLSFSNASRPR